VKGERRKEKRRAHGAWLTAQGSGKKRRWEGEKLGGGEAGKIVSW